MKIKIKDANTHITQASGYGQIASNIGATLHNLGHDVYFDLITGCSDPILDKLARKEFVHTQDTIYLWIRPPHYVKDPEFNPEYKNVFFTMHESETLEGWKSDWAQLLNKCVAVVTPTEWNKQVFAKLGVTKPIHVVPLGVNTNVYFPRNEHKFGVLTVHDAFGSENSRENWKETLDAFTELFEGNKNVYLTIKSWNIKETKAAEVLTPLRLRGFDIRLIRSTLFATGMADLYRSTGVFVKNSNREGWSIPMTEAICCGSLIIAYDNPVLHENSKGHEEFNIKWFKKKDQLKYYLDEFYKTWRDAVKLIDEYSWIESTKKLVSVLEKI